MAGNAPCHCICVKLYVCVGVGVVVLVGSEGLELGVAEKRRYISALVGGCFKVPECRG